MITLRESGFMAGSCLPGKQVMSVVSHTLRARTLQSRASNVHRVERYLLPPILSSFGQHTTVAFTAQQTRTTSSGSYSKMQQFDEQLYASRLEPTVGPVAVFVTPGAGLGLFTTRPVNPGDLLLISRPLATVSLNPTATASGPSKLIQTLLTQLLNPGQTKWLQLLSDRHVIAQQQQLLHGSVNPGQVDLGSDRSVEISNVIDLAQIQGLAAAGGKLERLQLTPMQLAQMVQECAYTLDPEDMSLTCQLMAAAAAAGSANSGAQAASIEQTCCGLWPELAFINRSCAPNVTVTLAADGQSVILRAADNMPAGTQLFLSQLQPHNLLLLPRDYRQQYLSQGLGLSCACSRCSAEADLIQNKPAVQQLLAALCTTAAAATAAMSNGAQTTQQQQQQQYYGSNKVVLESEGGAAAAAGSSGKGSRVYDGDDWMFEGTAQPESQAAASSSSSSSGASSSSDHFSVYVDSGYDVGSSSSSNMGNVVVAADYTLLDAAADGNTGFETTAAAAAGGGLSEVEQQQRCIIAVEWLQRLVIDLLELHQAAAAADSDTNLLLTAAAGSSWAAVRQALVILSSSSSSDGSSSSSGEQLLRTQLHYLLTEADMAPITGSSSSDLSWQELLIRVYDLEIKTLGTIMPGTLQHVMTTTAAAAMAAAQAQSKFERSDFGFDRWSNFDQGVYQQFYQVAGGFIDTKHRAVAAKFGRLSVAGQQQLVAAARKAAVAAGVMPAAAVTAAGSGNLGNIGKTGSSSSSNAGAQQQRMQQQQKTAASVRGPGNVADSASAAAAAAAAGNSADAPGDTTPAAAAAAAAEKPEESNAVNMRKSKWHKMSLEEGSDQAPAAAAAAAAATPGFRKSKKWMKADMEDDTTYQASESATSSSSSSSLRSSLDSSSESDVYEAEASMNQAAAAAVVDTEPMAAAAAVDTEPMAAAAAVDEEVVSVAVDEAASDEIQVVDQPLDWASDPAAAAAAVDGPEVVEVDAVLIETIEPADATATVDDYDASSTAAAADDESAVSDFMVDVESAATVGSSNDNDGSSSSSSSSKGHTDPKDWWSAAKAAAAAAFAKSSAAAAEAAAAVTNSAHEAPEVIVDYGGASELPTGSSSSSGGVYDSSSSYDSEVVTGSEEDWWSAAAAAAAQSDAAAAAAQRPGSPSWLSPAARAAAEAAAAAATASAASSNSRDSTAAISMSDDGDDLLDTSPQQQQQQQQQGFVGTPDDVAAAMAQPWTRGAPASWIRSDSSAASSTGTLSGDDFDFLNSPENSTAPSTTQTPMSTTEEYEIDSVTSVSAASSSSSSGSSSDANMHRVEAEYVDITAEAESVSTAANYEEAAAQNNVDEAVIGVEAMNMSDVQAQAVDQQAVEPGNIFDVAVTAEGDARPAAEGVAAAAEGESDSVHFYQIEVPSKHHTIPASPAAAAADTSHDIAAAESAANRAIPSGDYPLTAESASRLQQLIEWTVEVAGPLTASQETLVRQLLRGSSTGGAGAADDDGEQQQQQQQQQQHRGVLDREQVQLLRQLLGLV